MQAYGPPPPPQDPSVGLSKALSYVLRHGAAAVGLPMGPDGFAEVGPCCGLPRFAGVSEEDLRRLVAADPKGRFALRPNPLRIRANQGHSLQVPALELTPLRTPEALPPTLAHGTRRRLWPPIRAGGLAPMGRTHIHLAPGLPGDPGMRLDSEIAIIIDGPRALAEGIPFFPLSQRGDPDAGGRRGATPPKIFPLRPAAAATPVSAATGGALARGRGVRGPRTRTLVPSRSH
ncbi:tRNA 2'-phosphotransferase 1 isoform X2 [Aquila chrysaetos chrysaetos]|uniref:tRNA 2'-phosphotransferase 1 isoform X2 n=1 Tax=Aquila chrysaetos chrysaetos TaxID=223781 RepID=UPI00117689B3|nr:tRNA 2'-phosphotransferase 1 isoform X2 [Aquila chrysaetos chrysaetos]